MTVDRTELRRLLEAATPGPWEGDPEEVDSDGGVVWAVSPEDFALIVAMRNALPVLLDRLDTYQEALETICDIGETRDMVVARAALDTEPT